MGIVSSKVAQEAKEETAADGSIPTTPICTPKVKKPQVEIDDPRSPSSSILRTPITVSSSSSLTPTPTSCDTFNINSPALIKKLEDPRSPTLSFTRTPITAIDEPDLLKCVHLKNLESVRKVISDMPSHIPPKLLESSPLKSKPHENKRKSVIGLLETNLDYIETDLDDVILNKSLPNSAKFVSPSKDELRAKFLECIQKNEEQTSVICQLGETIETSTPIQEEQIHEKKHNGIIEAIDDLIEDIIQEVVQKVHVDDDGLQSTKAAEETIPNKIVPISPKLGEHSKLVNTATVREFEKKVSHLIYTEEEGIDTPSPKNRPKTSHQSKPALNRMPLGTRNCNNVLGMKSKPKLRVSDKPRRTDYPVSKIPVFNSKNKTQCENTPPKGMLGARKTRRAQWDNDNTLII